MVKSTLHITEVFKKAGFEIINDGIKEMWNPDEVALDSCKDFGKSMGKIIGETIK